MQQHLPFTVLKLYKYLYSKENIYPIVATALTVYGIETVSAHKRLKTIAYALQQHLPFTVLKLLKSAQILLYVSKKVATALTVYGIETLRILILLDHI